MSENNGYKTYELRVRKLFVEEPNSIFFEIVYLFYSSSVVEALFLMLNYQVYHNYNYQFICQI